MHGAASNLAFRTPLATSRSDIGVKFLRFAVLCVMAISVLAPVIRLTTDFWIKLDWLLLPVIGGIYFLLMLSGVARPVRANPLLIVTILLCITVACSLLYGTRIIGHPLLLSDLFDLVKPLFPFLFFTMGYEADFSEDSLRLLNMTLFACVFLVSLYAYAQWLNLDFTAALQRYYSGGLHDEGGLAHYRRVYSTLSNPNFLGMFVTWVIGAFTLGALFGVCNRAWNLVLLLMALVTLAMTGSRYGLIDTSLVLLLILFMPTTTPRGRNRRRTVLLAALPLALAAVLAVSLSNKGTRDRFQQLESPLKENSLRMRLDSLWRDAFDKFVESPLLGHGPAKIVFSKIYTDSEYLQVLKEYGLIGLVPYLCLFLIPLGMVWKGLRFVRWNESSVEQRLPATYWALCVSFVVIVTALFMNIGMSTYFNFSLLPFLWMWMGIGASSAQRVRETILRQHNASSPAYFHGLPR
jgi:O-antigen ligase